MKPAQRILGGKPKTKRSKKRSASKKKSTKVAIKIKGTSGGVKAAMKKILGGDSAMPI